MPRSVSTCTRCGAEIPPKEKLSHVARCPGRKTEPEEAA